MPRLGRLHIPGGCYHIMGRGLERRRIFGRPEDKEDFLLRLTVGLEASGMRCFAWSLMSNHYHLLLQVSSEPLKELMSPLLGGYAASYNRRHNRVGYVFQNRFKSILCDEENYLLELVRYIHLNPVRARMISLTELHDYAWTGHSVIMGKRDANWQEVDEVLGRFSSRRPNARKKYSTFIAEGIGQNTDLSGGGLVRSYGGWETIKALRKDHEQRIGDERILGSSDFVEKVLKHDELQLKEQSQWQIEDWDIELLLEVVCDYFELDVSEIMNKGRDNQLSNAKAVISYLGMTCLGFSSHLIAERLGISQPAVSKLKKKGLVLFDSENYEVENFLVDR